VINSDSVALAYPATNRLRNISHDSEISNSTTFLPSMRDWGLDGISSFGPHKALQHLIFPGTINVSLALTLHRGYDVLTDDKILLVKLTDLSPSFDDFPFDLGRFPALRHFNIQLPISFKDNLPMLSFLNQLLSISSYTSRIETLEIKITWSDAKNERVLKDLFSSGAEWSTLDEVLTSEKFVSLRKVVLDLRLEMDDDHRNLEYGDLTLSYVNVLFPMFRALTSGRGQRTLETHITIN
jgi:hypothetical protein